MTRPGGTHRVRAYYFSLAKRAADPLPTRAERELAPGRKRAIAPPQPLLAGELPKRRQFVALLWALCTM